MADRFDIQRAYLFLGYIPKYQRLYDDLVRDGFILIFKPIAFDKTENRIKGNCDGELILQAAIEINYYDNALIVSGDGDFHCLVNYLSRQNKLQYVLAPNKNRCSFLLKQSARKKLLFMDEFQQKLSYKAKGTA